ncbi:MAG: CinA family protein [Pirellulales bacterium]|nr:CinA family protein [Pirellulales bacterium]
MIPRKTAWIALGLAVLLPDRVRAEQSSPPQPVPAVDYMIVVTGGELLMGVYPDSHTQFLTRTLFPLGLHCVGSISVDDRREDIQQALRFAVSRARLIVVTGGLGPTENDVTREALSEFTGIALKEHPDVLRDMAQRFKVGPDQLRANLRRQSQVPEGGSYFKNSGGTAIGLVFEDPRAVVVALPGPPRELQPMVREGLVPYLSRRFGTRKPGCSLTLRFVGLGQSQISQTIDDNHLLPAEVIVSSQFEGGRVDYTFALRADTPQDRARLEDIKRQVLKHLGDNVYAEGTTSLEEHVAELLEKQNATLTLAEVGSGGALAAGLGGAEGARRVLAGAYFAPTEEKLRGLVGASEEAGNTGASGGPRLQLLASAVAARTGSQWAVAVGEVQQKDGGLAVEAVFRFPDGRMESHRFGLRGSDPSARSHLTTQLLDQLRRKLR